MPFTVVSACGKLPEWVSSSADIYSKRLHREHRLSWINVPLVERSKKNSTSAIKTAETQKIIKAIPKGSFVVALDEAGISMTTVKFAESLARWLQDYSTICFVIGGPDGLDLQAKPDGDRSKPKAWPNFVWSLSPLTFPHPMVRVLLAEQLYRACAYNAGHPYHRE